MGTTSIHSTDPDLVARVVLIDNTTGDKVDAPLPVNADPDVRYVMSRFAWLRRDAKNLVIESPLAHAHARVVDPRVAALVTTLADPSSLEDAGHRSGLSHDETRVVLAALGFIGAVRVHGDSTQSSLEDQVPITWEFHDLLFHTRARAGRSPLRLSKSPLARGSNRNEDVQPGDLALPQVDVQHQAQQDPPFGQVVEQRRSVRDFHAGPISTPALAELLARVMGVRADGDENRRRFPSGGAVFEIDAVVLAFNVTGLDKGSYVYRPLHHSLRPLRGDSEALDFLGRMAAGAAGQPLEHVPPAVVVFVARFNALGSHYQGIAYSLMLKHVGVLMAMMNLTAPLVGLGSVPLGLGDSDRFAAATGLDYYRHGSIGELALSSLAD
jgi:SagB-type dehydrogenase family enzyme